MLDAEMEEDEHHWLERHSHNQFFTTFLESAPLPPPSFRLSQDDLRSQTVYKLVYARAVTLLELNRSFA